MVKRFLAVIALAAVAIVSISLVLSRTRPASRSTNPRPADDLPISLTSRPVSLPVLCYHRFGTRNEGWEISAERFEQHLVWMKERGYTSVRLSDVERFLSGDSVHLPRQPILITVDDGYRSYLKVAHPLLQKHGFSAVLFIYPEFISKGSAALTWEQLRSLIADGAEVGSHSFTHTNLARLAATLPVDQFQRRLQRELAGSREEIEKRLGISVSALSYPYGTYDETILAAAKDAGYRLAFTVNAAPNGPDAHPLSIGRFLVSGEWEAGRLAACLLPQPLRLARKHPADGAVIADATPTVTAVLDDSSAIPTAITATVGGRTAQISYDPGSRQIQCVVRQPIKHSVCAVTLRGRNHDGTPLIAAWQFRLDAHAGTDAAHDTYREGS